MNNRSISVILLDSSWIHLSGHKKYVHLSLSTNFVHGYVRRLSPTICECVLTVLESKTHNSIGALTTYSDLRNLKHQCLPGCHAHYQSDMTRQSNYLYQRPRFVIFLFFFHVLSDFGRYNHCPLILYKSGVCRQIPRDAAGWHLPSPRFQPDTNVEIPLCIF